MSNVKCIVLTSGVELMGMIEEKVESIVIKEAAHVAMVPSGNGQLSYAVIPWLPYAKDGTFSISVDNILTVFEPNTEILNHYNRMFGSGIQIASSSLN